MNPTGLITPRADSLEIIDLQPVKFYLGINPMGLIIPRTYYINIIALKTV